MVSLNTYERNIQKEHAIFEPNEVDKLNEENHGLKLKNETLGDIEKVRSRFPSFDPPLPLVRPCSFSSTPPPPPLR